MKLLNRLLQWLGIKKEPTFIQKVDQWQTEMYNHKVAQELSTHK